MKDVVDIARCYASEHTATGESIIITEKDILEALQEIEQNPYKKEHTSTFAPIKKFISNNPMIALTVFSIITQIIMSERQMSLASQGTAMQKEALDIQRSSLHLQQESSVLGWAGLKVNCASLAVAASSCALV